MTNTYYAMSHECAADLEIIRGLCDCHREEVLLTIPVRVDVGDDRTVGPEGITIYGMSCSVTVAS